MSKNKIEKIFKTHVHGTFEAVIVRDALVVAGLLPNVLLEKLNVVSPRVYLATRVIKHLYDRRPAEEFDFLLENISDIIVHPDILYKNKCDKRGQFCLMKQLEDRQYFISLELVDGVHGKEVQIVTAFRVRSAPYLKEYNLLWSRRDGETHSS